MRFLYPKYRRNRLTAQRAGGGYNDQSNYCYLPSEGREGAIYNETDGALLEIRSSNPRYLIYPDPLGLGGLG